MQTTHIATSAALYPPGAGLTPAATGENPARTSASALIEVKSLSKEYSTGRGRLVLFENLTFSVAGGEMLAIVGQSGAGKSTLLHILGALDRPTSGAVYCASTELSSLSTKDAASYRNRQVGYVWQFHYL